jgi:hypothetical protein
MRSVIDDNDAAGRDLLETPLEYGPLETLEGGNADSGHAAGIGGLPEEIEMYTPYSCLPNE